MPPWSSPNFLITATGRASHLRFCWYSSNRWAGPMKSIYGTLPRLRRSQLPQIFRWIGAAGYAASATAAGAGTATGARRRRTTVVPPAGLKVMLRRRVVSARSEAALIS